MRHNRDDEHDEFGDPGDHDSLDDFGFISPEMTEEFARFIGDRWRLVQDNKPISVDISLAMALTKSPAQWLDAVCIALNLELRSPARRTRRARIEAVIANLSHIDDLARCVLDLPPHARAALRRVLENGGSLRLSTLERDFGDMTGDGWFWSEQPPTSSLGELRRRALLFIGRNASLRKSTRATALPPAVTAAPKRPAKIAVIPLELRESLKRILSDDAIRREEEHALERHMAPPDELLLESIEGLRAHYDMRGVALPLPRDAVEAFLRASCKSGMNPMLLWTSIETLLEFFDDNAHEIRSMDDVCGYHVSELATDFVDQRYLQRWTLDERRELIATVHRLWSFLRRTGRIGDEMFEEIDHAARRLTAGKRRLNLIRRPPPLGGELVLARINPNTGDEERFTVNHQRLILVWLTEFHQDWRTLLQRCDDVTDGAEKSQLIHELIALEPAMCELLVTRLDEDDADAASRWFYEENVIRLSVW